MNGKPLSFSVWLCIKPPVLINLCGCECSVTLSVAKPESHLSSFLEGKMYFKSEIVFLLLQTDNVELILRTVSNQHSTESQDNDQPDYDSVASDEDTDIETRASKTNRQKVRGHSSHRTDMPLLKLVLALGLQLHGGVITEFVQGPEFSSQHHRKSTRAHGRRNKTGKSAGLGLGRRCERGRGSLLPQAKQR